MTVPSRPRWGGEWHACVRVCVKQLKTDSSSPGNYLSDNICVSSGASVALSRPRSQVRLACSPRCSWSHLLMPACWLFQPEDLPAAVSQHLTKLTHPMGQFAETVPTPVY